MKKTMKMMSMTMKMTKMVKSNWPGDSGHTCLSSKSNAFLNISSILCFAVMVNGDEDNEDNDEKYDNEDDNSD